MSSNQQSSPLDFKKRFHRLADSDKNTDCEFLVGPQKTVIKGHKVIFSSASDVFEAMFFGNLKEEKNVLIEDLDPDGFRGMKTFIYTGEVSFTSVFHALETCIAARKYIIEDLSDECVKYVKNNIKPSEVLEFLDRCLKSEVLDEFNMFCCEIIRRKTDEVLASEYFVSISYSLIIFILQSPFLKLNSEVELFEHFERWALAEVERELTPADHVAVKFNDLKKHIRFLTIGTDEFVSKVAPSLLLTENEKLAIALNKMRFDSKMTSETLSMTLQSRGFTTPLPNSKNHYHLICMFEINIKNSSIRSKPIRSTDQSYSSYDVSKQQIYLIPKHNALGYHNQSDEGLKVHWSLFDEYLCFEAKSEYVEQNQIVIIKTKFRVLGVNQRDDLFFEKESRCIRSYNGVYNDYQGNTVLTVIPTSILQNGRFYRNSNKDCIDVEGTFDAQVFKL